MNIYISGKTSGEDSRNKLITFSIAASHIRTIGNFPIYPFEVDGSLPGAKTPQYLRIDKEIIQAVADAAYFMPGWESSEKCQEERKLCEKLGLPIFDSISAIMKAEE